MFVKNGIPFNVMRDDMFKHSLKSCTRPRFVLLEYTKLREVYLDKWKLTVSKCVKKKIFDFIPIYNCTIAFDGCTSLQACSLINIIASCPSG